MKTTTTGNIFVTILKVNNKSVKFKIDTGGQCNVLPEEIFDKIKKKPKLVATRTKLTAYGGTPVPVIGKCYLRSSRNKTTKSTKLLPPLEIRENVHLHQGNIWIPATVSGLSGTNKS